MNSGKYVFAQVLMFVDRYAFRKCVARYSGEHRIRRLNCWNQFAQLLFGQLTARNGLRDICHYLGAHISNLYHMGMKQKVEQSTLSRANENRDWRIFADFGAYLNGHVRPMYTGEPIPGVEVDNDVFALDSTTISVSLVLKEWAHGSTPGAQ